MRRSILAWAVAVVAGSLAPTPAEGIVPDPAANAMALLHDLEVAVAIQTQRGWEIDRFELDEMLPVALESLCRAPGGTGAVAADVLRLAETGSGTTAEAALRAAAGDVTEAGDALRLHRTRLLLQRALDHAGDCPFALAPHRVFLGRQTGFGRTFLHADGGGLATLRRAHGGWSYGGGGSGRVLVGRGVSRAWTWLSGLEVGGAAVLQDAADPQRLQLQGTLGWPVIARVSRRQWHVELDATPLLHLTVDGDVRGVGTRLGVLVLVGSLRWLDALPLAGWGASVEKVWAGPAARVDEWTLRAGLRVGFDLDVGAARRDRAAFQEHAPSSPAQEF